MPGAPGYDLTGLFIGSEGTFGIATKIWCRLTPNPEAVKTLLAVFPTIDAAQKFYDSAEYAPILKLRLDSTRSEVVLVEGYSG